ncbi:MAG: helix-turn-helix domain-containing protein [Nitrospirota bacterium]|nr:helix-turn-helix domain-containing protein [Nitrospirota bacterium]
MRLDVREIRRKKLLHLVEEAGGQKALAARCGLSAAYICQMLSEKVNRHVGHNAARRLEEGMGKAYGWMDVLDTFAPPEDPDRVRDAGGARAVYGDGAASGAVQRRNLWKLVEREGGVAGMAARCRIPADMLLGVMESAAGEVPAPLARCIERQMGVPDGWLDGDPKM